MRILLLVLLSIASVAVNAQAFSGTDFKALLLEAINAPTGISKAEVTGPLADKIRGQIGQPTATVMAAVSVIEKLPQEGCKRLLIQITTPGTLLATSDGKSRPLEMMMKLNMCPNGLPPTNQQARVSGFPGGRTGLTD